MMGLGVRVSSSFLPPSMSATFSKPPSSWSVAWSLAAAALLGSGLAAVLRKKKKNQRTRDAQWCPYSLFWGLGFRV